MSSLKRFWNNTKDLPFGIRHLCQGGMIAAPLLALLLVVPIGDWTVNERDVTYQELWASGAGSAFLAFTLLGSVGSWGMAARSPATRWAFVLMPSLPFLVAALHPSSWFTQEALSTASMPLSALATSAAIYVCLFHLPSMRRYFQPVRPAGGITQA
jgi:hypothetical protein